MGLEIGDSRFGTHRLASPIEGSRKNAVCGRMGRHVGVPFSSFLHFMCKCGGGFIIADSFLIGVIIAGLFVLCFLDIPHMDVCMWLRSWAFTYY